MVSNGATALTLIEWIIKYTINDRLVKILLHVLRNPSGISLFTSIEFFCANDGGLGGSLEKTKTNTIKKKAKVLTTSEYTKIIKQQQWM